MQLSTYFLSLQNPPSLSYRHRLCHHYLSKRPFRHKLICTLANSADQRSSELVTTLQSETLKTLEWPSLCNYLSPFTSTSMAFSLTKTAAVPVGQSREESQKLLDQTTSALHALEALKSEPLDLSVIEDVSEILHSAASGQVLTVRELCRVRRMLGAARAVSEKLAAIAEGGSLERYTPLLEILQGCNFQLELERKIGFCIDCSLSTILGRASEELELIREERKRNMENLDFLLKEVSVSIFQAGGIDKPLITKRRSRMCVGVKATHKYLLPGGVVLNVSSSGATYFMEPKEAVELNNIEVKLSNSEKAEEMAILSLLTSEIAESEAEIKYLLDRLIEVDLAFARAAYAQWVNGVCPILSSKESEMLISNGADNALSIDIEGMQHPLLLGSFLSNSTDFITSNSMGPSVLGNTSGEMTPIKSSKVVSNFPIPIDIKVQCGTRVVIISGPNTGGKTASMKTLGLASIMSKAGMYLPAKKQPRLPWFDLVLADIGDSQSLEQSLSTFSGHISQICEILEVASKESLVLIDEIGSGTDPSEGVALSTSILQYLKNRVYLAFVTTHYADLSRLKEMDPQYENAAMEFSLETLQPTYQILWGRTGDSNALTIAKSIGFDGNIIERAKMWVESLMPEKQQERKGVLQQSLMEERNSLEAQFKRAESLHAEIMKLYYEVSSEAENLEERERALRAKETQKVEQELNAAKSQIETVVQEFENQLQTANSEEFNSLVKKSESAINSILKAHQPGYSFSFTETDTSSYQPVSGEQVHLKGLGNKLATVVAASEDDDTVLVQYGKIRVRVEKSNVRPISSSKQNIAISSGQSFERQGEQSREVPSNSDATESGAITYGPLIQTSKNTVDLRGMRVEEAELQLDMAIAARGSNSVLFIVHGMGTGVIKERALEMLRNHPRVMKYEQEKPLNYGCTVAYINSQALAWHECFVNENVSPSEEETKNFGTILACKACLSFRVQVTRETQLKALCCATCIDPNVILFCKLVKGTFIILSVTRLQQFRDKHELKVLAPFRVPRICISFSISVSAKMLAVFEKAIGNPPEELRLPSVGLDSDGKKTREEILQTFRLLWPESTFYHLSNGNFMTLSHGAQGPLHPRSMVVMDDIFCIFIGTLVNISELRRHYGLSRQATEAMLVVDAYKVFRDRAPYPPDQVIKDLEGKFAFILFDAKSSTLFVARDREGSIQLKWGMAGDGSLVLSDDPNTIEKACGKSSASFPPGCIFMNGNGLVSIDHPVHKVKAIARQDDDGKICGAMFQVDLFTRLQSIPRNGSAANWADTAIVEGD